MPNLSESQINRINKTHDTVLTMSVQVDEMHTRHKSCPFYNNKAFRSSGLLKLVPYVLAALAVAGYVILTSFGLIPSLPTK